MYLAEGLGHGFCALTETATVTYLCSTTYRPGHEHGIHPLDPELGIGWPADVAAYIRRHPEYVDLIHPQQRGVFGV